MFKLILTTAILFLVVSTLSAVAVARSRRRRIPCDDVAPWADPYTFPFGEVAPLPSGSILELHEFKHSTRPANRADQGSGAAAARPYRGRERRAF